MKSFSDILPKLESMPLVVTWTLQSIAEKRGCQELYTRQSPDKLRRLREYAMIESAVASNRIEGVEVDQDRVGTIVFGNGIMKDRDEEEVRGYRRALELIHTSSGDLPLSVETICRLHALTRPSIWDSGKIREKECEIIQTYSDGTSRVRFRAVAPSKIREYLEQALEGYENILRDARIPALVALAAFNLDFLCIHPFRDGNGRVSRLLLLFMLYRLGYEAGRYVSMERLIELSKDRYYETLEKSSASCRAVRRMYFRMDGRCSSPLNVSNAFPLVCMCHPKWLLSAVSLHTMSVFSFFQRFHCTFGTWYQNGSGTSSAPSM